MLIVRGHKYLLKDEDNYVMIQTRCLNDYMIVFSVEKMQFFNRCGGGVFTCDVSYATATAGLADPCPALTKYLLVVYDCVKSKFHKLF